jgi:hypothetical protein
VTVVRLIVELRRRCYYAFAVWLGTEPDEEELR